MGWSCLVASPVLFWTCVRWRGGRVLRGCHTNSVGQKLLESGDTAVLAFAGNLLLALKSPDVHMARNAPRRLRPVDSWREIAAAKISEPR